MPTSSYPPPADLAVGVTAVEGAERCPYSAMVANVLRVQCGKALHPDSRHGVILEGVGDFVEGSIEWTDERG